MQEQHARLMCNNMNQRLEAEYRAAVHQWLDNLDQRQSYKLPPVPFPAPVQRCKLERSGEGYWDWEIVIDKGNWVEPAFTWSRNGAAIEWHLPVLKEETAHADPEAKPAGAPVPAAE